MDLETLNNYRKEWNEDYNDEDDELLEMYTELPDNTFKESFNSIRIISNERN